LVVIMIKYNFICKKTIDEITERERNLQKNKIKSTIISVKLS